MDHYHHGNLREAVLERAAGVILEGGPSALSLRSLAADLGVSHTAPRHHFGSREGVFTALATQGFTELSSRLRAVREGGGSFLDAGVAYVAFALDHPAHFQVMFTPGLADRTDAALVDAGDATYAELREGVDALAAQGRVDDAVAVVAAAWSLVHGMATLALGGSLERSHLVDALTGTDLLDLARRATGLLYGSPRGDLP